jgi:hypothetical protein
MPAADDNANSEVFNQNLLRKQKLREHIRRILFKVAETSPQPNDSTKP